MTAVYVHIPYCVKKCLYCDFCSRPLDGTAAAYPDALIREIALRVQGGFAPERVDSIFFGGGTPTALPAASIVRILDAIRDAFPVSDDTEISVECNPGTAAFESLRLLRKAGFNRISIGLQSADDALLAAIGRVHTYPQFLQTVRWAQDAVFSNINVDVMHGLPHQTRADYLDTLKKVCDLEVQHVSAYALILEPNTPFAAMADRHELHLPDPDLVADMQDDGIMYLESRGYRRYEVSNFARDGFRCQHNMVYWRNEPYIGFGVAAHSALPDGRRWLRFANTESIASYLAKLSRGRLPIVEEISLSVSEQIFETVMLGLRMTDGVDLDAFCHRFGIALHDVYADAISDVRCRGWWKDSGTHLALNARGMDMLNAALLFFR